MEQKFTKGKWHQSHRLIPNDEDGMYATQVYDDKGETICTLSWYPKPQEKGMHEGKPVLITGTYRDGNAQLISKAPELLEAVINLQKRLEFLINATPTGIERNAMCDENIICLELINSCVGGV